MRDWKTVPLGDACEVTAGGTPSRANPAYFGGGIPWVKIGDMLQGTVIATEETITRDALNSSPAKLLPAGTVLISIFATIGRTAVLGVAAATNQAIAGITPRDPKNLTPEYLRRYLDSVVSTLERRARGVAQVNINSGILRAVPLPLPPLSEQQRIAATLDKADALRARRRDALNRLDTLTQSAFLDMFGDPFAQRGNTVRLDEMAEILMGQSPPGSSYNLNGEGTPLLNGPTEFGERHPVEKQWTTNPVRICAKGDILFCVRGATAGRLNRADKAYCLGRGLAAIRQRDGAPVSAEFLFAVLDRYYSYFQAKGVGSTFINISRQELEGLPIPRPLREKADALSRSMLSVETLKSAHAASLAEMDTLFASLQHRAFRGEI